MEFKASLILKSEKNIVKNIEPIMLEAKNVLSISEEDYFKIFLSTVEVVNNAAEHGNKFDENKSVLFEVIGNESYIEIIVKDQGIGFIPDVEAAFQKIECDDHLCDCRGRGIFLIHSMMDEVTYKIDNGTLINMKYELNKLRE